MKPNAPSMMFALLSAAFVFTAGGCQNDHGPSHAQAVKAADDRWTAMRSGMILQMAQQQFDTGDLEQCDRSINEALQIDKKNPRLYTLAGRVSLERGQLERAFHLMGVAIELQPKSPDAQYYQGLILQRWQQFDSALVRYRQAYANMPDNAAYLLAVAEMLVAMDKLDDAKLLLLDRMAYFDQNPGIRAALAQMYMLSHDYPQAALYYQQASLLKPDDRQITEQLGQAYAAGNEHDKAIKCFEGLLARSDWASRRDLQMELAGSYTSSGRLNDAKNMYLKMTRVTPEDSEVWIKLANVTWEMEDLSGALLAANRSMALAPRRHEGYIIAGLVWQKRGEVDKSLSLFDRASTVAPDSALPLILRGLALEKAGRTNAAAQAYAQALQRKPEDDRAKALLTRLTAVEVKP